MLTRFVLSRPLRSDGALLVTGHTTHYETLSQLSVDTLSLLILFNLPLKSFSFCKLFVLIILFCLFSFCWCLRFYSHFICQICCTQKNSQNTFLKILETWEFFLICQRFTNETVETRMEVKNCRKTVKVQSSEYWHIAPASLIHKHWHLF